VGCLSPGILAAKPLDGRERRATGAAHKQSVCREEFLARFNGLALGYQTTSSILACDSKGGTMLEPTPGLIIIGACSVYRRR